MHPDDTEQSPLLARPHQTEQLRGYRLYMALVVPNLALLLAALDVTLTATLAATIASSFDSLNIIAWLGTAYLVASTATQPLSGKLSDRFGRRNCLFLALILFAIGNLLCGVSQRAAILIMGRAVAGAGAGAMSSTNAFIINDLLPLRKRPVWQGVGNGMWAAGMGLGSVTGGVLNDLIGWRWAFNALAPLTLVLALALCFTLPPGPSPDEKSKKHRVDLVGAVTFPSALVFLTLGLNNQEQSSSWTSTWAFLVVSGVLLLFSTLWELFYAQDPIVPVRLLANRNVAAACSSNFFVAACLHTLLFYVPLQIQARGYSTTETGTQLLGEPVGAILGSLVSGWAMQAMGGYGLVKPVGLTIFLAAPLTFFLSNLATPVWVVEIGLISMEGGFGFCLTVLSIGMLAATEQRTQAASTAMLYAFRQIGASSGLSLAGVLFRQRLASELGQHRAVGNLEKLCHRNQYVGGKPPSFCVAYNDALHFVFLFALICGGAALATGMLMRNIPLEDHAREETEPLNKPTGSSDSV